MLNEHLQKVKTHPRHDVIFRGCRSIMFEDGIVGISKYIHWYHKVHPFSLFSVYAAPRDLAEGVTSKFLFVSFTLIHHLHSEYLLSFATKGIMLFFDI